MEHMSKGAGASALWMSRPVKDGFPEVEIWRRMFFPAYSAFGLPRPVHGFGASPWRSRGR